MYLYLFVLFNALLILRTVRLFYDCILIKEFNVLIKKEIKCTW